MVNTYLYSTLYQYTRHFETCLLSLLPLPDNTKMFFLLFKGLDETEPKDESEDDPHSHHSYQAILFYFKNNKKILVERGIDSTHKFRYFILIRQYSTVTISEFYVCTCVFNDNEETTFYRF